MPDYKVKTPDGNTITVRAPEGATDEQVLRFAKMQWEQGAAQEDVPEKRSLGSEAIRQLGLTGRHIVEGVSSLPAMFAQPIADLGDMALEATGSDFRFGNQAANISGLLSDAGLPEPETATERVVGDASQFLAGGGSVTGAAQRLPGKVAQAIAARPGLQAAGEVAAGAGSGGAREAGLPPWAQMTAGVASALAVPFAAGAAPFAGRKIGEGVDSLRQLFGTRTDGMVEEFAGSALPQEAQRRIRAAERMGQPITPAEATGDPILAARQGALGTSDEGARSLVNFGTERAAAQRESIDALLDRISSGRSFAAEIRSTAQKNLKAQQDALSAEAAPLYKVAFESALDDTTTRQLLSDPLLAKTAESVRRSPLYRTEIGDIAAKSDKITFRSGVGPKKVGVSNGLKGVRFWDLVKRHLDDDIEAAMRSGERNTARMLQNSRNKIIQSLDAVSPDYAAARAIYGEGARPLQALREGAVGRIANLPDDKLKNVSKILFDPNETNPKVLNQLREQFVKENPAAWKGIIRNEIERRLDATKAGREGSNFYNAILAKDRDFRLFLNATRGMPDVQRTLIDMRRIWKDLINPESVKGAAGKAKSSLDVPRSSVEAGISYIKNFLGGKADKAAVDFITDPRWADDLARIAKIESQAARERELVQAIARIEGSRRAAGAVSSATAVSGPDGS